MIELEDDRWSRLHHAYGEASDIPALLAGLAASPGPAEAGKDDEPWHRLWSCLCHQGDVYEASYAAVPHIVKIACETRRPIDFSFFLLPSAIEIARNAGRGPDLPKDMAAGYHQAIALLQQAVTVHAGEEWDQSTLLAALTAQAVAKGHFDVAEAIMNLDDDWIAKIIACEFD